MLFHFLTLSYYGVYTEGLYGRLGWNLVHINQTTHYHPKDHSHRKSRRHENTKSHIRLTFEASAVCWRYAVVYCKVFGEMYGMLTALLGVQAQQNALQSLCWGSPSLTDSLRIWQARSREKHKERIEGRNVRKGRRLDRNGLNVLGESGLQGIERREKKRRWSESREYYKLHSRYLATTVGGNRRGASIM